MVKLIACALTRRVARVAGDDRGATAVEYCLIAVLVAAVIAVVVTVLGQQVSNDFQSVMAQF